jgi:hypothetical protein
MRFSAYATVVAITVIAETGTSYHFGKLVEIVDIALDPVDHLVVSQIFASKHHGVTSHDDPFFPIWKGVLEKQVSKHLVDRSTEQPLYERCLP